MGNKFILEGDEINPNSEPDEKGDERKVQNAAVVHVPENRQPDGRWKGTLVYVRKPMREIIWKGLTDKNSDKLYAPKQLLPQSDYDMRDREIFERCVTKYRKLLDGAKEGIK